MSDGLFHEFLTRLQPLCPQARILVRPFGCEELPDVRYCVDFLGVPRDRLTPVSEGAYEIAYEIYGDDPLPFCFGVVTPEHAAREYVDVLGLDGDASRVAERPGE